MGKKTVFEVLGKIQPGSHRILAENQMKDIIQIIKTGALTQLCFHGHIKAKEYLTPKSHLTFSCFFLLFVNFSSISWTSALYYGLLQGSTYFRV